MNIMKSKWISVSSLSRAVIMRYGSTSGGIANGGTESDSSDTPPNNASSTPPPSISPWSVINLYCIMKQMERNDTKGKIVNSSNEVSIRK